MKTCTSPKETKASTNPGCAAPLHTKVLVDQQEHQEDYPLLHMPQKSWLSFQRPSPMWKRHHNTIKLGFKSLRAERKESSSDHFCCVPLARSLSMDCSRDGGAANAGWQSTRSHLESNCTHCAQTEYIVHMLVLNK